MTDYFSLLTGLGDQSAEKAPATPAPAPASQLDAQPSAKVQPVDFFSDLAGVSPAAPASDKTAAPDPNATPDAPTWIGRRIQDVTGRQDQRFKDLPTVFDQFHDQLDEPTRSAAVLGASDPQMGDIIQKSLGDKFVRREKDANGYEIFVTRGPDGQEQAGYLNRPGLDLQDVSRAGYGSLPYLAVGGATGAALKGAGIGIQALAQGAGAGATSVAGDLAQKPLGSEQGIEPTKALVATGAGLAGPPLAAMTGAVWRKFVTIPGLVDRGTGQLTEKGASALKEAGIDPASVTPDFANSFAKSLATSGNPAQAATEAGLDRFGIPATRGQITKDPYLLTQEEGMRRRLYGEDAQNTIRAFDQKQQDAIRNSALGDATGVSGDYFGPTQPKQGIGEQINPGRQPGAFDSDRMPATLGSNVQDTLQTARKAARDQESALWDDGVKGLAPTPEALATLPDVINPHIADIPIDTVNTPVSASMRDQLTKFMSGTAPETIDSPFKSAPVKTVDQMRRRLLAASQSANPGQDKLAADALYNGFNDWIDQSAAAKLLDGDPAAAMQLAKARGFTKEVRTIFQPKAADGTVSPAGQRLAKVMDTSKADSGESVVNALIGSQGSRGVTDGTVGALKNIKIALDRFAAPEQASQAWNDIRLAYWTRLVTGKNGEMVGPTALVNNLKNAFQNQTSIVQTLYSPLEQRQMREFARAVAAVAFKPPNASGSGYTAASFARDGLLKLLDAFGIGTPARAALERTGVVNAWNAAAAKQALRRGVPPQRPNITPAVTGAAQAIHQDQSGR